MEKRQFVGTNHGGGLYLDSYYQASKRFKSGKEHETIETLIKSRP